jgi:hypothetical protein
MATILDKDLVRESLVKVDNREILITLTEDQKISLKLKGLKSGDVSIGIKQLYNQLINNGLSADEVKQVDVKPPEVKKIKKIKNLEGDPQINLYSLRANVLVTKMDFKTKMELENVICRLIEQQVKIFDNE